MAADRVLERAAWGQRSPEFGRLLPYDDGRMIVVMELAPLEHDRLAEWMWLQHLWLDLPAYPLVLDAIERAAGKLLVRYAAIDWQRKTPWVDRTAANRQLLATWGAQLTDCFIHVSSHVPRDELHHFARPFVKVDLVNNARVGFQPVARDDRQLPPEASTAWPACTEQTLMFVIGGVVRDLALGWDDDAAAPIAAIVRRCLHPDPSQRHDSLAALARAWREHALPDLAGPRQTAWDLAQEGVGWLAVGRVEAAVHAFRMALDLAPRLRVAKEGLDRLVVGEASSHSTESLARKPKPWSEIAEDGLLLEEAGKYRDAIWLYESARRYGVQNAALDAAIARCHLAHGSDPQAMEHARRALAIDPRHLTALAVGARAELRARRYDESLQTTGRWLDVDPDDGLAHYTRGRALLALGRCVEARDAFDRAYTLRPQMLEAMLLRREADRLVRHTRTSVGQAKPMTAEVPAHLGALQDALVSGRADEAIAVLERSEYDDDGVAKLVHAECLAFARRFDDAIAMFDRAVALAPEHRRKALVGKVHALLALERAAEAVAELDRAPSLDAELVELRGLALERLGSDDAERELRRSVAVTVAGSDLRLGRKRRT